MTEESEKKSNAESTSDSGGICFNQLIFVCALAYCFTYRHLRQNCRAGTCLPCQSSRPDFETLNFLALSGTLNPQLQPQPRCLRSASAAFPRNAKACPPILAFTTADATGIADLDQAHARRHGSCFRALGFYGLLYYIGSLVKVFMLARGFWLEALMLLL